MTTPCTNISIPANAYTQSGACGSPEARAYLTGLHQILQCEYDNMVSEFFTGTAPAPKTIAAENLDASVACDEYYFAVSFNPANTSNNDEITVVSTEGAGSPGNYSIALIAGIKDLFNPDAFHFSKAIGIDGNATVAFYVTVGAETKYCGDLSGLEP